VLPPEKLAGVAIQASFCRGVAHSSQVLA
jgi:hypothetical protein